MLRVLIILLPIALAVYALVDLVQTDDDDVQGLPKIAWVVLIVLIGVIGPLAWILAGKKSRRLLPRLMPPEPGTAGHGGGRQVAPDDDPDFLRGLRRPSSPPRSPQPPPPPDADLDADLEALERELRADDSVDAVDAVDAEDADAPDEKPDDPGPDDPPLTSR